MITFASVKWLLPICFLLKAVTIAGGQDSEEAPHLTFINEDGFEQSLADLRGEVVYLSFWAGWCKPCIDGFEKYADVRTRLDEMGINLLNVSIDASETLWKSNLQMHQINGTNAFITNMNEARDPYQLYSIPAYFIIGKDGHFRYLSDAPDRDIYAEFQGFLDE